MNKVSRFPWALVFTWGLVALSSDAAHVPPEANAVGWGFTRLPTNPPPLRAIAETTFGGLTVSTDGTVQSWPTNFGSLQPPAGLTGVVDVATGIGFAVALKEDGSVVAWGNAMLQPVTPNVLMPANLTNVTAIAAGSYHALALTGDGHVYAWGRNDQDQCAVPDGLTNAIAIAACYYHSVALRADGTVVAWGSSSGGQTLLPPGVSNVVGVAASIYHTILLKADGTLLVGGPSDALTVVPAGLTNVMAIDAGDQHCLALRSDGTVVSWGGSAPIPNGLSNVEAIYADGSNSVAWTRSPILDWWSGDQAAVPGTTVQMQVSAHSYGLLTYQWLRDGVELQGATNAALALTNVNIAQSGLFSVVVSNTRGSAATTPVYLAVGLPHILNEPVGQSVGAGSWLSLSTWGVLSCAPTTYQWLLDGEELAGATNAWMSIASVQLGSGGDYRIVVRNSYGAVTSAVAHVEVYPVPVLDQAQTSAGSWADLRSGTNKMELAQTFTPALAGRLEIIQHSGISPVSITEYPTTFTVVDTVGGQPGTNVLGQAVVTNLSAQTRVYFTNQDVFLETNRSYAFVLSTEASLSYSFREYSFRTSGNEAYPRGALWARQMGGTWLPACLPIDATKPVDLVFSTYMQPGFPPIRILRPDDGSCVAFGRRQVLEAAVWSAVTNVAEVTLCAGGAVIGTASSPPFAVNWTPASGGQVDLLAIVRTTAGFSFTSAVHQVTVLLAGAVNDNFADRILLEGDFAASAITQSNATLEIGEPRPFPASVGQTVWWEWTAPRSGEATVMVEAPDGTNAVIGVFSGPSVDALFMITNGLGQGAFNATTGGTYQIMVDSLQGTLSNATLVVALNDVEISTPGSNAVFWVPASIPITAQRTGTNRSLTNVQFVCNDQPVGSDSVEPFALQLQTNRPGYYRLRLDVTDQRGITTHSKPVSIVVRPANDNFESAEVIVGSTLQVQTSNEGATYQASRPGMPGYPPGTEPIYAQNVGGHSIWYRWTAPYDGVCTITGNGTNGAVFNLVICVYFGQSLSALSPVALNASSSPNRPVVLNAVAGKEYNISIDGFFGEEGPLAWSLSLQPPNDSFSSRQPVRGTYIQFVESTAGSTLETGEAALAPSGAASSLWWSWLAPLSGEVRLTATCNAPVALGVYRGISIGALSIVTRTEGPWTNTAQLSFPATQGETYQFAAFGPSSVAATLNLELIWEGLRLTSPLPNSIVRTPASLTLGARLDVPSQTLQRVEYFADGVSLGVVTNPPFSMSALFNAPKTYVLTVVGQSLFGDSFASLPVPMLIYAGKELPVPNVFAGMLADCSYVVNAAGALWVFGANTNQFGRTANDDMAAPFLARMPAGVARWEQITVVRSIPNTLNRLPWSDSWIAPSNRVWALGDDGQLYADGVRIQTRPPGVTRWKSIHGGPVLLLLTGDDGNVYADVTHPLGLPWHATPWVDAQSGVGNSLAGYFLTLDTQGNIFTHGAGPFWQPVSTEIPKPSGINRWTGMSAAALFYVLKADNGELYSSDLHSTSIVPLLIPRPPGVTKWLSFAAGGYHVLAIGNNGELYGWGRNWEQQLGLGASPLPSGTNTTSYDSPVLIPRPPGVTAWSGVAAGQYHSLALGNDCSLYAWGENTSGQAGQPPSTPLSQPTRVANIEALCGTPVLFTDGSASRQADGTFRLQFNTDLNRAYLVQYSDDATTWKNAFPTLLGTGKLIEWTDAGPPGTDIHPGSVIMRVYRVVYAP